MHGALRVLAVGSLSVVALATAEPAKPVVKQAAPAACDALVPPPTAQFPPGFDYPQSASTIQSWVKPGGGDRMRFHAYCLFAGLNNVASGASAPFWARWGTSTQAFPYQYNSWKKSSGAKAHTARPAALNAKNRANAKVGGVGAINNRAPIYGVNPAIVANPRYKSCLLPIPDTSPQLYELKDGEHFQSNGDIMVATVAYNQAALDTIARNRLFDAATLDAKLPAQPSSPSTSIASFPATSIVLKVMQWPVAGGGPTWSSVTALPVWDWDAHPPGSPADGRYAGYEIQSLWTQAAAISSGLGASAEAARVQRVQFLYGVLDADGKPLGPNTYDAPVVGLDRFYSKTYTDADLNALSDCDRAILDASAYWTYNREFRKGDSLVMVAMHMMTKEQSDWTFQSAWWHPDAQACTRSKRYCGDRPTAVPGGDTTYTNYMLTTTYGTTQQTGNQHYYAPPGTKGPVWPVAYNPYIELAASHPITTNCMNCHHRAAWPPDTPQTKPDAGRSSTYLQTSPPNPNPLEVFLSNDAIFNGLLMLDSMWAVSDRAGYAQP